METQNESKGRIELRSRYLLSSFDRVRIVRGEPYEGLRPTVVIFVCGFDPIGLGRRLYVVRPTVEGTDRALDDGTMRACTCPAPCGPNPPDHNF